MWLMYAVVATLILLQTVWLIRKKKYRDTVVFAAVSLAGLGLWACVVSGLPIYLNTVITSIFDAALSWLPG